MNANLFSLREKEIFHAIAELKDCDFVIIGGYAVNAYALPRFSVDCDIVIKDEVELERIEKILLNHGYSKEHSTAECAYSGSFLRFEKYLGDNIAVSMDVLIKSVTDRMTGAIFSADWVFENSKISVLRGKTMISEIKARIINIDALLAMKIISCRPTDIRDVFMMLPNANNSKWIKAEIQLRCNFNDRIARIVEKVSSPQFKDGLAGVYSYFDPKVFEKHRKAVVSLREC